MTGLKPTPHINSKILWVSTLLAGVTDSQTIAHGKKYIMDAVLAEYGLNEIDREQNKIFISGPMAGYEHHNYPLFNMIEEVLIIAGYKCVNPANIGMKYDPEKVDKNKKLYKAMVKEIQEAEKTCNTILLLPGWENSVGVRLELQTAIRMKMKIVLGDHLI